MSGARLVLRPPGQADVRRLFELYRDPRVWGADPLTRHDDPAQTSRMVENWRAAWDRDGLGMWTAWHGDEFVGIGGCFVASGRAHRPHPRLAGRDAGNPECHRDPPAVQ